MADPCLRCGRAAGACPGQGWGDCEEAREARHAAMERELEQLREAARCFVGEADIALHHAETRGGQQVTYCGDWAGVIRVPSGIRALRQWRAWFARALGEQGGGG